MQVNVWRDRAAISDDNWCSHVLVDPFELGVDESPHHIRMLYASSHPSVTRDKSIARVCSHVITQSRGGVIYTLLKARAVQRCSSSPIPKEAVSSDTHSFSPLYANPRSMSSHAHHPNRRVKRSLTL